MEGPSTDTAPSAAEVRASPAQAGLEAGSSAAATKETAPDAELVARETGLAHSAELVEKFRADYAGVEVDPEANLTEVRTGRLDQLPSATHARLLSAATEMKGFAEGMIAKLSAADHSLLVSVSVFLWGRASAPTVCSRNQSGSSLLQNTDLVFRRTYANDGRPSSTGCSQPSGPSKSKSQS